MPRGFAHGYVEGFVSTVFKVTYICSLALSVKFGGNWSELRVDACRIGRAMVEETIYLLPKRE